MVKRPPVIPIVRVVHVCPPVVVHTKLSDFRAVVQELTGVENNTLRMSVKGPAAHHEPPCECAQVSQYGSSSPPFLKGPCTPGAHHHAHIRASTHDHHQSNHTPTASPASWIESCNNNEDGALLEYSLYAPECNKGGCSCKHGTLDTGVEKVWPCENCFEGFLNEEVCTPEEAVSAAISSSHLSSPIRTTASSFGNCIQSKTREGDLEHVIAETGISSRQVSELMTSPNLPSNLIRTRKPRGWSTKKARLRDACSQESLIDPQHVIGDLLLNSLECLSSNEGNTGFISPSNNPPSLHADFHYHHLLQRFDDNEDNNDFITPFNDSGSLHADFYYQHVLQRYEESTSEVFPLL